MVTHHDLQVAAGLDDGWTLLRLDGEGGYVEVASSDNRAQMEQTRSALVILLIAGLEWEAALERQKADPASAGIRWW